MASGQTARTVLITGANRGIGLSILQRLASAFPENLYLLGCRHVSAGHAAIDELRSKHDVDPICRIQALPIDVTSKESITEAAETVRRDYNGCLDVLINNAGVARLHSSNDETLDLDALQRIWEETFLVNVFAPHMILQAFLPFLLAAKAPRVINISSGRASLNRSTTGGLPPTASISYSVSKVALNGLGVEMEKTLAIASGGTSRVWSVNPGHCKTAFNGYRGTRDPFDGAGVVEALLQSDRTGKPEPSGFWEEEDGKISQIPW